MPTSPLDLIGVVAFLTEPGVVGVETAEGTATSTPPTGVPSIRHLLPTHRKAEFRLIRDGETETKCESGSEIVNTPDQANPVPIARPDPDRARADIPAFGPGAVEPRTRGECLGQAGVVGPVNVNAA